MVRRQVGVVLGLAILAVAAVSWLAVRPGTEGATADVAASGARVFTSVRDIMQSIVDPSADVLWNAVGTVVDETGFHEALPKRTRSGSTFGMPR
jgi:predicted ATPase